MPATFNKVDYIMITVSNMARSVAFYKDKLGIPMKFGTPEWTEFQTGTTVLALHGGGTAQRSGWRSEGPLRRDVLDRLQCRQSRSGLRTAAGERCRVCDGAHVAPG